MKLLRLQRKFSRNKIVSVAKLISKGFFTRHRDETVRTLGVTCKKMSLRHTFRRHVSHVTKLFALNMSNCPQSTLYNESITDCPR